MRTILLIFILAIIFSCEKKTSSNEVVAETTYVQKPYDEVTIHADTAKLLLDTTSNRINSETENRVKKEEEVIASDNFQEKNKDKILLSIDTTGGKYFVIRNGCYGRNGIYLYKNINSSLQYYIFSMSGNAIFKSSHFKNESYWVNKWCGDEVKGIYYLLEPTEILDRALYVELFHKNYLVVGSKNDIQFIPPELKDISEEQMKICLLFEKIKKSKNQDIHFQSLGYKNKIHRVVYTYSLPNSYGKFALVEFGENNKLNVLYESDKRDDNPRFCGQADLDFDGFSETILLDFGQDRKGILKNIGGVWKLMDGNEKYLCY